MNRINICLGQLLKSFQVNDWNMYRISKAAQENIFAAHFVDMYLDKNRLFLQIFRNIEIKDVI